MRGAWANLLRLLGASRSTHAGLRLRDVGSLGLVAAILALIEILGRNSASESSDAVAAFALAGLVGACADGHRRWGLRWTAWLCAAAAASGRRFQPWRFELGVDLRGRPPIASALPPRLVLQVVALAVLAGAAGAWICWVGEPLRDLAMRVSCLGYLAGAALLWTALVLLTLLMLVTPVALLFDLTLSYTSLRRAKVRSAVAALVGAYFLLVLACAVLLPLWVATVLLAVSVLAGSGLPWLPPHRHLDCLWRARSGGRIRSIGWRTYVSAESLAMLLVPLVLVVLALGSEAVGLPDDASTPVSTALGSVAAWVCGCGLIVCYALYGGLTYLARWHDPERPAPTVVHFSGAGAREVPGSIRERLERRGWKLRFAPARPRRTDVCVHVSGPGESPAETPETSEVSKTSEVLKVLKGSHPLPAGRKPAFRVAASELEDPRLLARIARRDEIQRRRILMRTLESIFRRAATRPPKTGTGYWVAPQYWFVPSLTRDQMAGEHTQILEMIPPLYYRALPHPVRRHFLDISRALEVDLIFLEDGLGFRGLRHVLRVMFEQYDIHGGRQPAREIHFAGLPKIRVILHDFTLQEPLIKPNYPEPDYEEVGRARILHVFRDRGEDEELEPTPDESDHLLSPVGSPG